MADSTDKTSELDQYGVWVKKPPRDIDGGDTSDLDLPDFSDIAAEQSEDEVDLSDFLDSNENTDVPAEEPDLGADNEEAPAAEDEPSVAEEPVSDMGSEPVSDEEVSLDDFLDKPFEDDAPAEEADIPEGSGEDVSADEFMLDEPGQIADSPETEESAPEGDDAPLDIDLTFDDSPAPEGGVADSSEEIDISSFDDDSESSGGTTVDMDNFDDMFDSITDESSSGGSGQDADADDDVPSSSAVEEVALADFGIGVEEDSSAEEEGHAADFNIDEDAQADADSSDLAVDDSGSGEYDIDIGASDDDDSATISISNSATEPASSSAEDDFDFDSVMNNVTDENGNTVSVGGDESEPENDEVVSAMDSIEDPTEFSFDEPDVVEPGHEDIDVDSVSEDEIAMGGDDNSEAEASFADSDIFVSPSDASVNTEEAYPEPDDFSALDPSLAPDAPSQAEEAAAPSEPEGESYDDEAAVGGEAADGAEDDSEPEVDSVAISIEPEFKEPEVASVPDVEGEQPRIDDPDDEEDEPSSAGSSEMLALMRQLAGEFTSLKSEITNLKSDFANLKDKMSQEARPDSIAADEAPSDNSGGFFGDDDDGDDSIALDSNELDNIISNAEITVEEPAGAGDDVSVVDEPQYEYPQDEIKEEEITAPTIEETFGDVSDIPVEDDDDVIDTTDISMDLGMSAETPQIDDIDMDSFVPDMEDSDGSPAGGAAVDDILVDSSSSDLMGGSSDAAPDSSDDDLFLDGDASDSDGLSADNLDFLEEDKNVLLADQMSEVADDMPSDLKSEVKMVLSYMDQLLESLPEEKITEFAKSEQFETYKKLFHELGLA